MLREPFVSIGRAISSGDGAMGQGLPGIYYRMMDPQLGEPHMPLQLAGMRAAARTHDLDTSRRDVIPLPALTRTEPRYALIDLARVLCAVGVISAHVGTSPVMSTISQYSHLRLPFFMLLAMFFLFRKAERNNLQGWKEYAIAKTKQLYLPFLLWGCIYLVLKNIKNILILKIGGAPLRMEMLLDGNSAHLWFLPYLVVACAFAYPVACWLMRGHRLINAGVLMLAGLAVVSCPAPVFTESSGLPYTIRWTLVHGWSIVPCIPWGLAAALAYPTFRNKLGRTTCVIGLALIASAAIPIYSYGRVPILEAIGGLGLMLVAFTPINNRIVTALGKFGRYSFGIYLIHMVFVNVMKIVALKYFAIGSSNAFDMTVLISAAVLSLATSILLARSTRTRWLIAWEPAAPKRAEQQIARRPELAIAA